MEENKEKQPDLIRYEIVGGTGYNDPLTFRPKSKHGEWVEYDRVKPLLDAAIDFVNKVESGRARSVKSYNKFKQAIKIATNENRD